MAFDRTHFLRLLAEQSTQRGLLRMLQTRRLILGLHSRASVFAPQSPEEN